MDNSRYQINQRLLDLILECPVRVLRITGAGEESVYLVQIEEFTPATAGLTRSLFSRTEIQLAPLDYAALARQIREERGLPEEEVSAM